MIPNITVGLMLYLRALSTKLTGAPPAVPSLIRTRPPAVENTYKIRAITDIIFYYSLIIKHEVI